MTGLYRCRTCGGTFPDEGAAMEHMIIIHDWILGPDGTQPPKKNQSKPLYHCVQPGESIKSIMDKYEAFTKLSDVECGAWLDETKPGTQS